VHIVERTVLFISASTRNGNLTSTKNTDECTEGK